MKYLKTAQYVPGKGEAWMYYELDDQMTVQRYCTHIPMTGECEHVANPIIKQLFRPEMMQESTAEEFQAKWSLAPGAKA